MDIKSVAASRRNFSGTDYLLLWAGVAISLSEIWAGGFVSFEIFAPNAYPVGGSIPSMLVAGAIYFSINRYFITREKG